MITNMSPLRIIMRHIALKKKYRSVFSLTGLCIENFDVLLSFFSDDWDDYITLYH